MFLVENSKLPMIIAPNLEVAQKNKLLEMLQRHKKTISWKIADIWGINPSFCTDKILMEDDFRPKAKLQ